MPKKKSAKLTAVKPPVVTIMGHVDHGKTTLLDSIRHSEVTATEQGGITQHIGAYQIERNGGKITFIDTPGHAAFSKMRARGAQVTDIAVLVVAADDGVKPQTKESIRHIKEAGVPIIVAINKIDIKGSSPEMVKAQLVKEDINVEGYGGNTPVVEISARQGTGVDKLLDTISILAELEGFTADPLAPLSAVVIESEMKKNQGPTATLLIQQGTLNQSDRLVALGAPASTQVTAKRLLSDQGKTITSALPSTPVQIIGFKQVPLVGTVFTTVGSGLTAPTPVAPAPVPEPIGAPAPDQPPVEVVADTQATLETDNAVESPAASEVEPVNIKIILKSDTQGTLEAIAQNLGGEIEILKKGVGDVNESDVLLAESTGAAIIAFNVATPASVKKLAIVAQIPVRTYTIIYKLLEDFEKEVLKLLEPTIDEEQLGVAIVKAVFTIKGQTIAGCAIDSGSIALNSRIHFKRDKKIITDATVVSLKQGKEGVLVAKAGTDCGILVKPKLDIKVGDKLISYKRIEEK